MDGQSATLVQKSRVMSAPGTNSTASCAWMLAPGEEFLQLSPDAKTEDISLYLTQVASYLSCRVVSSALVSLSENHARS